MRHCLVGLVAISITTLTACEWNDPLTEPPAAPALSEAMVAAAPPLAPGQFAVDAFGPTGPLGADWYVARPAYVIDSGQVSALPNPDGTTLVLWRRSVLPADQFAELIVGDLAGGSSGAFRGLQVFVRARPTGERVGFVYNSPDRRYELTLEVTPGQVMALTAPVPGPVAGDVMRLEAAGDVYVGRLNGRELLRARGPVLAGRMAGFAVGIDRSSRQSLRRVVDAWSGGALPVAGSMPLTEMEPVTYRGFRAGLYPGGRNEMPARHDSVGRARARGVVPRDVRGVPSPAGKYVLLSMGMSNTTQEWCAANPGPCSQWTFTGQAMADPAVNRATLVIANGAMGGQTAATWDQPTDLNYNRVRDGVLAPRGLSELQVQAIWLKVANPLPALWGGLPGDTSDADLLVAQMGNIIRSARVRYPNLQLVFVSSRIYAGYAVTPLNPEPYAYESGLAVKWLISAQIAQMTTGQPDSRAGDLNYQTTAPWIGWGPYLWANGTAPRRDGLSWLRSDFEPDGTHPSTQGERKVGTQLLNFFKTDARASCWFLAGTRC